MDENEFFRQATLRIFSSLNIETAMRHFVDYLRAHMPVSGMFFAIYEPDLNIGRFLASIWPAGQSKPRDTIQFPREFWNWMKKRLAQKPETRIINDFALEDPPVRKTLRLIWPEDTSQIYMDLAMENRRLGSLGLFVEGKSRYTDEHARLISLLHDPFTNAIANILQHQEILRLKDLLADDNRYLHQEMMRMSGDTIIGSDFGLRNVMELVRQVAPLDSPVLFTGETGVGKEVMANAIHLSSTRKESPYIKVNCGAIPENLIDSELFGHEKGAFTGAISKKRGRFERAHEGTIFLDEIGELPPAAQVRLLRVLQQHEIERVGGTDSIPVNVRLISATHQNLEEMVRTGAFREDLWFRINVFPIAIPPLRGRREDIPALVAHFIERKSRELKIRTLPSLAPGALEQLQGYHWPGNVRELENLVERALIFHQMTGKEDLLSFDHIPMGSLVEKPTTTGMSSSQIPPLDDMIASHIRLALKQTGGRVEGERGAAQVLGLHPSTLRGRMRKLGIPHGRKG